MLAKLDRNAIRSGALGVVMFVLPAYILVMLFASGDESSPIWLVMGAALLFGSTFGGYVGARDYPPTPLTHASVSAGVGLGVSLLAGLLLQLVTGDLSLAAALTALVILYIGIAFGALGGLLASKGFRPK